MGSKRKSLGWDEVEGVCRLYVTLDEKEWLELQIRALEEDESPTAYLNRHVKEHLGTPI